MTQQLAGKLQSKNDFYVYMDKHRKSILSLILTDIYIVQYYLPPPNQVNKDFLRQVFADEKKLFKKKNVDFIHVPQWDELSVKNLWKDLKDDAGFNLYF